MTADIRSPAEEDREQIGELLLPMSGINAVATLPEHRRSGFASTAVLEILDPSVPALHQLLEGADPWCPFFY